MQKIRSSIEGIDNPAIGIVRTLDLTAFLHHEPIFWPRGREAFKDNLLGRGVGLGDKIRDAFFGNLQRLGLAEIARQPARRFAGGIDHDIEEGGGVGHGLWRRGC